jgi:hypothetical protein
MKIANFVKVGNLLKLLLHTIGAKKYNYLSSEITVVGLPPFFTAFSSV